MINRSLLFISLIILLCLRPSSLLAATEPNVVISDMVSTYVLTAGKDGKGVARMKQHIEMTFRATRTPGEATAFVFYDDTQTIDKAKCKNSKPVYMQATSAGIFFDDSRVCVLPVKLEEVGKDVTAVFERTFNRPDFGAISFLSSIYPVSKCRVIYRMPASLQGEIDLVGRNLPENVSFTRELSPDGKEYVITVTATDLPPMENENSAPGGRRIYPYLQLTGFYDGVGSLYSAMHSYTLAPDPDPEAVVEKAREITAGCAAAKDKIAAIGDWVHENIRYIAIEHGDLGNAPDSPSEVLRKRFGDCKGSAALIKAMLKAVGIDGRLVWIGTDDIPDDWTEIPQFASGNHMIAAAVLPDTIIYIDGTVGMADPGYCPAALEGRQTVIEDGDRPMIGRVPELAPAVNIDSVHVSYTIVDGQKLKGRLTESVTGAYKANLLNRLFTTDRSERDKVLASYLREQRRGFFVGDVTIVNARPGGGPTVLSAEVESTGDISRSGGKLYVSLNLLSSTAIRQIDIRKRKYPLRLKMRCVMKRVVTLEVPEGMVLEELPSDFFLETDLVAAGLTYDMTPGGVTASLTLTVKIRMITEEAFDAWNSDVKAIMKAVGQRLILSPQQ
ncbi:MAG: transglutaminase family protein [Staphylococcus sp.]|nr:transglutaminase family protein [Staphylococcus sp.]